MKNSIRALITLIVFGVVAWYMNKLVTMHANESSVPAQQIHLAGAMAGLFTGLAAAFLVGIAFALFNRD